MICYDREFPESARILMLQGAEILLVPNACPMEGNRLSQLRARAFENMVGIATCNYAYGQPDCNGHSSAFDGVAYGETQPGVVEARDTLVVEAGELEGIYPAAFPMDTIRAYREPGDSRQRLPASRQVPGADGGADRPALYPGGLPKIRGRNRRDRGGTDHQKGYPAAEAACRL